CIWYEMLRRSAGDSLCDKGTGPLGFKGPVTPSHRASRRWLRSFPLEFGSFGALSVRREAVELGLARPLRVLYASDLHLGHWWTNRVPAQLLETAQQAHPDIILLGGDLVDERSALTCLHRLVHELSVTAPVSAIPGNHDDWV